MAQKTVENLARDIDILRVPYQGLSLHPPDGGCSLLTGRIIGYFIVLYHVRASWLILQMEYVR